MSDWRAWCTRCDWRGPWLDDQDDAYRDGLAHQADEHPGNLVGLEERTDD